MMVILICILGLLVIIFYLEMMEITSLWIFQLIQVPETLAHLLNMDLEREVFVLAI